MNEYSKSDGNTNNLNSKTRRTTTVPTSSVNARRKCRICRDKPVDYGESRYGAICKACWLGLKMFNFDYHNLYRAMKSIQRRQRTKLDIKKEPFNSPIHSIAQVKVIKKPK